MKTKWVCKGCSSQCTVETEEDLTEHSKCIRWELSIPRWEPKKEKSMEEMMEDLIKLYPGCEWAFSYKISKDAGGEYVPCCFVQFGNTYYQHESGDLFIPLFLDDNGAPMKDRDFTIYYETAEGGLETDPLYGVKMIYDEVMRRRNHE